MSEPAPADEFATAGSGDPDPANAPGVRGVPLWLGHFAALGWRGLVVLALLAGLLYLASILFTATASVIAVGFIAATAAPLHRRLQAKKGWSRSRAAVVTWLISWLVIAAVAILIAVAFLPVAAELVRGIVSGLQDLRDELTEAGLSPTASATLQQLGLVIHSWIVGEIGDFANDVATVATVAILSFFLSFFVILDADRGWAWTKQFVPAWSRDEMERSSREAVERVGGFVRDAAFTSIIRTVIVFVALLLLGVPTAGALAALVFLGGFVPYLGGVVTTSAVVLVALVANGAIAAIGLLALIVAIDLAFIGFNPGAATRPERLHPAVVLIILLVGASIAGLVGMFAAVPAAAFIAALSSPVIQALGGSPDPDPGADPFIPPWFDRVAQWSWRALVGLALMAVLVLIIVQLPGLVGAAVLGAILAATFAPVTRYLLKRGLSPTMAALTATLGTAAGAAIIIGLTVATLIEQASAIADAAVGGSSSADQASGGILDSLVALVDSSSAALVAAVAVAASNLAGLVIMVLLAGVMTFFLLRDGADGWAYITRRLAGWRRRELDGAADRAVGALGGYMIGTGVISIVGAVTQWFIMVLLGLPLALPLAILAFFLAFIPYFGSFIATGLAFLVAVKFGSAQDVVIMGIFTIVINLVQGSVLGPIIYGRAVSIHPAMVLLAVPVGAALAGIVGMFLIIPVLGIIATTWRAVISVFGNGSGELPAASLPPVAAPITPMPDP